MLFEQIAMFVAIVLFGAGCFYIIGFDRKRYGLLYLASAVSGNVLCFLLTYAGFYSFPNNVLHGDLLTPVLLVSTAFPLGVLVGVRYSPEKWAWKIPFYWAMIHLGVLAEAILLSTSIFAFEPEWDMWDSYTLRWGYYLLFELLGGKIVPPESRRPIVGESFRYGRWAWIIVHVIVITTIFLAGVYTGVAIMK